MESRKVIEGKFESSKSKMRSHADLVIRWPKFKRKINFKKLKRIFLF